MAELLGPRSGTAWVSRTGENKHRAFPSRQQSLRAAIGSLEEKVLPLLRNSVRQSIRLCDGHDLGPKQELLQAGPGLRRRGAVSGAGD